MFKSAPILSPVRTATSSVANDRIIAVGMIAIKLIQNMEIVLVLAYFTAKPAGTSGNNRFIHEPKIVLNCCASGILRLNASFWISEGVINSYDRRSS